MSSKWIPLGPLPYDGQRIFITIKGGKTFIDRYCVGERYKSYLQSGVKLENIVAWMPIDLPEPYMEESEDDE